MTETRIPEDHFIADHPDAAPPIRATPPVQQPAKPEKFDLQDCLVVIGFVSVVSGVTAIYFPAGLIAAGLMLGGSALAIERAKNPRRTKLKKSRKGEKNEQR